MTDPQPLVERGRQIADAVAARVAGALVLDEAWAWRILVKGRGYCLLRRDTLWVQTTAGGPYSFGPMETHEMVDRLVAIMDAFPNVPPLYPVVATPLDPVNDPAPVIESTPAAESLMHALAPLPIQPIAPVRKPWRGVRKTELARLEAEGKIFEKYKH
jgi:hypothetical protein